MRLTTCARYSCRKQNSYWQMPGLSPWTSDRAARSGGHLKKKFIVKINSLIHRGGKSKTSKKRKKQELVLFQKSFTEAIIKIFVQLLNTYDKQNSIITVMITCHSYFSSTSSGKTLLKNPCLYGNCFIRLFTYPFSVSSHIRFSHEGEMTALL